MSKLGTLECIIVIWSTRSFLLLIMHSNIGPRIASTFPTPEEVFNYRVYVLALISSMGAFFFGYDLAFIGTTITLKPFLEDFGLEHATQATLNSFAANIVSLLQAGCFFGAILAAPVGDKIGRKLMLILTGAIFCIGSVMQTASMGNIAVMFIGRAIGGLGVGAASMLVPLYIAEASPPSIRGRLVGIYEVAVQCGSCMGFWINYGIKQNVSPSPAQWQMSFTAMRTNFRRRWLLRFRSREAAIEVLAKLRNLPRDHQYIIEEVFAISDQIDQEREAIQGKGLFAQLQEAALPSNRRRLILGMSLFVFMQMAGSNAINYYSPRIFASMGLKGENSTLISTGIYGLVRFIAVGIAMYWVVDRYGRRRMLIGGSLVAAFAMWFIGAYVKLNPTTVISLSHTSKVGAGGYAAVAMIYIYAVAFCFSWAGIPWIYASEMFPLQVRSICMAICSATHWLMNFMIARSVPYMLSSIRFGTYFLSAASLTVAIPFVYFILPETKGLSLEEIDAVFRVGVGPTEMTEDEKGGIEIMHRE